MKYRATAFVGCDNQAVSTVLRCDLISLSLSWQCLPGSLFA
jgi:hypothetical protein